MTQARTDPLLQEIHTMNTAIIKPREGIRGDRYQITKEGRVTDPTGKKLVRFKKDGEWYVMVQNQGKVAVVPVESIKSRVYL